MRKFSHIHYSQFLLYIERFASSKKSVFYAMLIRTFLDKIDRFIFYYKQKRKYRDVRYNISVVIDSSSSFEGTNSIGERSFLRVIWDMAVIWVQIVI